MAKEISGYIKLQIMGGQANPAPPVVVWEIVNSNCPGSSILIKNQEGKGCEPRQS